MSRVIVPVPVRTIDNGNDEQRLDLLAVEEPLEIRVNGNSVSVTMRTPGRDGELALGFLFSEGVLRTADDVHSVSQTTPNIIDLQVQAEAVNLDKAQRSFYTTSSCGLCGKSSLETLEMIGCPPLPATAPEIRPEVLYALPDQLRKAQSVFDQTGGLHAAALFDFSGALISVREDIGRHNALDKLVGAEFLNRGIPLSDRLLLVSGRVSFELVQKALMAGIPAIAAVGAPSSLAVEIALRFRLTLIGFLRSNRFNIYANAGRVYSPVLIS